jgi:hypothetical protein
MVEINWLAVFTVIALGIALTAFFAYAVDSVRRPDARSDAEGAPSATPAEREAPQAAEPGKVPVLHGR